MPYEQDPPRKLSHNMPKPFLWEDRGFCHTILALCGEIS
jgi:hypothetical protein